MHTTPISYTDIDYESFPIADLYLDRHWVQLPTPSSPSDARPGSKPSNASASPLSSPITKSSSSPPTPLTQPIEEELWPIINHTVQQCLRPHPELRSTINAAVIQAMADHRGWRNPFPTDLDYSKSSTRAN